MQPGAGRWRYWPFCSRFAGLNYSFLRNGNKLVGAVESTCLACTGARRRFDASELELPRRGILQLVLAYPIGAV